MAATPDDITNTFPVPDDGLTQEERLDNAIARIDGVTEDLDAVADIQDGVQFAYGRGWSFNYDTGQFDRYGTGPVETTGLDTLKVWVEKVLRTYSGSLVIYPPEIGVDPVEIIGAPYNDGAMAALMDTVRTALLAHDRIMDITEMAVDRDSLDDDFVVVSFTIITDTDDEVPIETEVVVS